MDDYKLGYPKDCNLCTNLSAEKIKLQVAPYTKAGNKLRLMLIGQDPTIKRNPERVKQVLMLDEPNGQLSRWLTSLFGSENYQSLNIYATNLVKCTFNKSPSITLEGGLKFLKPYYENCKGYLLDEIRLYKSDCVIALGEPTHKLFRTILDNKSDIQETMQEAFTGKFTKAWIGNISFDYSPCLHIQTWRVAETYGDYVKSFKAGLANYFK